MSVFEHIKTFLKRKTSDKDNPEGFCPNCWGRQEYEGKFYEALQNEKVDIDNILEKKGWIDAYALEHLEGIRLENQEDETLVCPSCKVVYRPS